MHLHVHLTPVGAHTTLPFARAGALAGGGGGPLSQSVRDGMSAAGLAGRDTKRPQALPEDTLGRYRRVLSTKTCIETVARGVKRRRHPGRRPVRPPFRGSPLGPVATRSTAAWCATPERLLSSPRHRPAKSIISAKVATPVFVSRLAPSPRGGVVVCRARGLVAEEVPAMLASMLPGGQSLCAGPLSATACSR